MEPGGGCHRGGPVWVLYGGPEVYRDMQYWANIRRRVLVEGESKRQVCRTEGLHWDTLQKMLAHSEPPGYRRSQPRGSKLDPYWKLLQQILDEDQHQPKKQRHTVQRIWQRLWDAGFDGGYTIVKDAVRELRKTQQEVYVPLAHDPGKAQVDFGHAVARIGGVLRKIVFFAMVLPYSDAMFVMAFERECTETFWEGHLRAFEYFGGVPRRIRYDNSKIAVKQIVGARERQITQGLARLESHYLFDHEFCRVRRANEKGVVEGVVKFARQNFLVPVPDVKDLDELNAHLLEACRSDLNRRLRGEHQPKRDLLQEEQSSLLSLPEMPFDACRATSGGADSESLVRFEGNDYSVPVEYAHHDVSIRGYVDRVEIGHRHKTIAVHPRYWDKERMLFEPVHYLPLLERKPGAFDQARPLRDWPLPACFDVLRRRLEAEDKHHSRKRGTREYIRVLRLLEKHPMAVLKRAVERGLEQRVHSRDGIAQLIPPPEPWGQTTFTLDGREHLRHVQVAANDVSVYSGLLTMGGES